MKYGYGVLNAFMGSQIYRKTMESNLYVLLRLVGSNADGALQVELTSKGKTEQFRSNKRARLPVQDQHLVVKEQDGT